MDFVEFSDFGLNALTLSAGGTIFFTCLQCRVIILQAKRIRMYGSSLSISPIWFLCSCFMHMLILAYGISQWSFAITFHGLLTPFYLPVIIRLWKFPGTQTKDWIIGLLGILSFCVGAGLLLWLGYGGYIPIAFVVLGGFAVAAEPLNILRTKKRGSLEVRLVLVNVVSSTFWTIYGFTINDGILKIVMPLSIGCFVATLMLWFYADAETVSEQRDGETITGTFTQTRYTAVKTLWQRAVRTLPF